MNNAILQKGRVTPAPTKMIRLLAGLSALVMLLSCFVACKPKEEEFVHVDYVAQTKLDLSSDSLKIEATVKSFIDGDTTHFYVEPCDEFPDGVVKVRYLAINTPESTGKLEEWGKAAAAHTKEKLKDAYAIMLESDDSKWNQDSNGRHLLWVWYKPDENSDWRNLNIEILQNGYAVGSNSGQNRYGTTCLAALNQADKENLHVHSDEKDPSFPYGAATEVTLKELRTNHESYIGVKVAVEGIIAQDTNGTLYIEQFDAEDEQYYGMQVYYGNTLANSAKRFLTAGNFVHIVGTFQYHEAGKAYQIAGLEYDMMKPNDPALTHLIEKGTVVDYPEITDLGTLTTGEKFQGSPDGDTDITIKGNYSLLHTSVSLKGLTVTDTYVTADGSNKGAISLTCEKDGKTITVRTVVLYENNQLVDPDRFMGKTIDVVGVVDAFAPEGKNVANVQVKVFTLDAITIY